MTTAQARAVPYVFSGVRASLMASASAALLVALAPTASAAPNCTGTGAADTCVITLANIGVETVDAGATPTGDVDTLQFTGAGLVLNANTIGGGDTFTAPLRFLDFEAAQVTAGSDLTLTGTGTSTYSLAWTVDGSLTVNGGNAIGDLSAVTVNAGGLLDVDANETIGSLAGAGNVDVAAGTVLTAGGNNFATTYSGVLSGAGGFTKAGNGTMKLTGANTFTGALSVTGGVLEVGHANAISTASGVTIADGTLSGVVDYSINGNVTITTTNAISRLTGNATINGNVTSNGGLQPGHTSVPAWPVPVPPAPPPPPNVGQSMGQITINGNYEATGNYAYVGMFIDLDDAAPLGGTPGTTHDFLTIIGNMIGTTRTKFSALSFDEFPVGAATTGNGIQVIRITGTSANAGLEFYQGNSIVAGPHQYLLRYVPNYAGTDDGYFLQSAARDEVYGQAALLSASQSLIRGCYRDDQRIPDSPKGATYGRAWFGYRQGSSSFGADTGVEQDQDFSCSTGGMDWRMGHGWFGGVSGGFGSSNSDIETVAGTAKLDGDSRVIEAYAAFTSSAFFLNLSAGYADMDWMMTSPFGLISEATSGGLLGSVQAGIGLGLEPLAVKLIGMINYDGTNCGDDCFGFAVTEETGLLEAKGALRFDGVTWGGSIRPWAQVAYSTILSDGVNTVVAGPYTVVSDTNDELLQIDAGLQTYLDENLSLYLDGGYNESLSKDISGYRASAGLKLYW
jgi:autotransporter-associated beta strand protein